MDLAWLMVGLQVAVMVAMLLVSELGFRRGRRRRLSEDASTVAEVGVARATTFGILGILVAFGVSMAQERFVARRQLILDEANAIGTTYLRSKYLAPPHDAALAPLFRRYVDARVAFYEAGGDEDATVRTTAASDRIQNQIWAHAVIVAREDPLHGDTVAEFVTSLNTMIDLEDARVASLVAHVPPAVLALLILVGLLTCGINGYACGLRGNRAWISVIMVPLLIGIATDVILDLDSPRVGIARTGQAPMLRLQESLASEVERGVDLETPVARR